LLLLFSKRSDVRRADPAPLLTRVRTREGTSCLVGSRVLPYRPKAGFQAVAEGGSESSGAGYAGRTSDLSVFLSDCVVYERASRPAKIMAREENDLPIPKRPADQVLGSGESDFRRLRRAHLSARRRRGREEESGAVGRARSEDLVRRPVACSPIVYIF
jgi:hypothetical protein